MGLSTRLYTLLHGKLVGRDISGNRYYLEKSPRRGMRVRCWVLSAGPTEASAVPPEWEGWLHYTTDTPSPNTARHPWQRARVPNATGTPSSIGRPATTITAAIDQRP